MKTRRPPINTEAVDKHEEIVREILRYCVTYPDAKDTAEGILKWWLAANRGQWGKQDVHRALTVLTQKGWLLRRQTRQSEEIYGLKKDHLQEIKEFLGAARWNPKPRRRD